MAYVHWSCGSLFSSLVGTAVTRITLSHFLIIPQCLATLNAVNMLSPEKQRWWSYTVPLKYHKKRIISITNQLGYCLQTYSGKTVSLNTIKKMQNLMHTTYIIVKYRKSNLILKSLHSLHKSFRNQTVSDFKIKIQNLQYHHFKMHFHKYN